ncbi:methyl-accepting chemotaxis protein [Desulfospira joergensenii]|uniref:methyl-accepting chemotaxis protein n=1 Tax=Desulfospira joergensenii TaxID=53329 RepID=UPI0003B74C10|nr:methyl-accepting chemotaxis protein [Desulfospira joergensenii]
MNDSNKTPEHTTAGILSRLPELSESLGDTLQKIEPQFAQLGQDLQMVYAESGDLAKGIMNSADGMTDRSETGLLHHIGEIVDDSLTTLSGCREMITGSLQNITASTGHLSELCSICETIRKSSRFLNIIGLNIGVESCRTSEATAMFENFGEEIKALAGNIGEISATIYGNSETVRKDQLEVHNDITDGMKTFDELSQSAETAVQQAMEEIETIGGLASSTLEKAGSHSQKISNIVGEIVMSIQFHDIARQQIEHIISALGDISDLLGKGPDSLDPEDEPADDDGSARKGRAQSILALQAAHLKQVIAETKGVYEKMQASFESIGDEVDQLMENVSASCSEEGEASGLEQGFKNFRAKLEDLGQLLNRGNELEEQIKKTMDQSSRAVSTLSLHTDQVTSINIDLQYKAINAIIMTNKLGDKGATLEVLARSVRDLSNESNTLVKEVLNIITSITDLAVSSDSGSLNRSTGEAGVSGISLEEGIGRISNAYEEYRESSFQAEERSRKLMESIDRTRKELDFFPEWIESSAGVLREMEDLLEVLAPWKGLGDDLSINGEDDLAQRYTMESERKIHEELIAADGKEMTGEDRDKSVEVPEPKEGSEEEEDGLDDNIELF